MSEIDAQSALSSKILTEINRKRVLKLLYQEKSLTRREISDILNLSHPTVSKVVDRLLEEGFISEGGRQQSTGGRKPRLIIFEPTSRFSLGIDVHREGQRFVLADLWGYISISKFYNIAFENTPAYWQSLVKRIEQFLDGDAVPREKLLGVGIAICGIVAKGQFQVRYSSILGIRDQDLSFLQTEIPYPVLMINDAYAAGYTEAWNSSRLNLMCYLSISEGISGAIMMQSELFTGFNNRAGSVGHMIIQREGGRECVCGRSGCFEAYCSTLRLTEPFNETLAAFFQQLEKREPKHLAVWEEYLDYLAVGVSNIRQCLDIAIIIGGQLGSYIDDYIEDLYNRINAIAVFPETTRMYLNAARFGKEACALGAALQLVDQFLDF